MNKANESYASAKAILEFTQKHLLTIYNISGSQAIEANGDIVELQSNEDLDGNESTEQVDSTSSTERSTGPSRVP